MKTRQTATSGSLHPLVRLLRRKGIRKLSNAIGLKCNHSNGWCHTVGVIERITPTMRLAVRHWNRVHIVPWNKVCDIYDECPDGKYGTHRRKPNAD